VGRAREATNILLESGSIRVIYSYTWRYAIMIINFRCAVISLISFFVQKCDISLERWRNFVAILLLLLADNCGR
jgi:hypothetical protein